MKKLVYIGIIAVMGFGLFKIVEALTADFYPETNDYLSDYAIFNGGDANTIGQSFTVPNGRPIFATSAKFLLKKGGSPTGSVYAKIYAHTGTYGSGGKGTGTALATSDAVNVAGISAVTEELVTFTFTGANSILLNPNGQYVVAFEFTGGDGSNYVHFYADNSSPSHSGNLSYFDSSWNASSDDAIFYFYGFEAPASNVTFSGGQTIINNGTLIIP